MFFNHIHIFNPSINSSQVYYLMFSSFLSHKIYLCCLFTSWTCDFHWSIVDLLGVKPLKQYYPSFYQQLLLTNSSSARGGILCTQLHARILSDLSLQGSCACYHKPCELIHVTVLQHLENTASL